MSRYASVQEADWALECMAVEAGKVVRCGSSCNGRRCRRQANHDHPHVNDTCQWGIDFTGWTKYRIEYWLDNHSSADPWTYHATVDASSGNGKWDHLLWAIFIAHL